MQKVMKNTGNMASGVLATCLALALALLMAPHAALASITADSTAGLTVSGLSSGDTVRIYKVVDATYDASSNSLTYAFAGDYGLTMDSYTGLTGDSDEMKAAADKIAAVVSQSTPAQEKTADSDAVTFSGLPMGQYLVLVNGATSDYVYQNTVVSLVPSVVNGDYALSDATATVKKEPVSIDKKVAGADSTDAYSIGDKVPFTITATVPVYPEKATDKTFAIGDVQSSGLTFDDDVQVAIGTEGKALTAGTEYKLAKTADGFKVTFDYGSIAQYAGQNVTVSYTATINDKAAVTNPETNKATLEFSTNPYDENSHKTKDDHVDVTTYGVYLQKVAKDGGAALSGAEFAVYKADENGTVTLDGKTGKYRQVGTIVTGDDGYGKTDDLGAGTYCLKETKAPAGYVLSSSIWEFTISKDKVDADGTYAHYFNEGKIENAQTPSLPQTGDVGGMLLVAAGCAIAAAGVAVLAVARRRSRHE